MKSILYRTLAVLETDGNNIREPYSKFLGDGIYEVRVQQVNNIARVLYFFVVNKKISKNTKIGDIQSQKVSF